MDCPNCSGDLQHRYPGGIEVDVCAECDGVWLDAWELDGLLGLEEHSIETVMGTKAVPPGECRWCGEELNGSVRCTDCQKDGRRRCPRGDAVMDVVSMGGIELDRCPECAGLWVEGFERRRLSRLRERLRDRAVAVDAKRRNETAGQCASEVQAESSSVCGDGGGESMVAAGALASAGVKTGPGIGGQNDVEESDESAETDEQVETCGTVNAVALSTNVDETPTLRDYIEQHGELDIVCSECSETLTRYIAWEQDGEFYCPQCADGKVPPHLERALRWREPSVLGASAQYDEAHLLEVLKWMVDGLNPWK